MSRMIIFFLCFLLSAAPVLAEELTVIYTGETHAMVYPCRCPKEPDGGIARRASLVKKLRKEHPAVLVLDSGRFFSGGATDEYAQNAQLDSQRALVNLKAMGLMRYDAAAISDDEFNFGREFLEAHIEGLGVAFVSCNARSQKILPYVIKEAAGLKVGITGVTPLSAKEKAGNLEIAEPLTSVRDAVAALRQQGSDIVVLLSSLGPGQDAELAQKVPGIDIIIAGHKLTGEQPAAKVGATLIAKTSWQGRRLCYVSVTVKNKKIIDSKVEDLRLSDAVENDPDATAILPRCFSDLNCGKEGLVGICQDAGSIKASCQFIEPTKVGLTIIKPRGCMVCETEGMINFLRSRFPGLVISYLTYPDAQALKLVKDFGIQGLPAYLLGKEVVKEKTFDLMQENLEIKGDYYMVKPQLAGIAYFLERPKRKGAIDLFINLFAKDSQALLSAIRELEPTVHFLALEDKGVFDAAGGNLEVEEYLRSVCVQKYYPSRFWDYIICRAKNNTSSWWQDCASEMDEAKIKTCARGPEGAQLLRENTALNKELKILFGPTYLADNQEVFSSQGVPSKEELKKIFKH
ncbi:MAG TPA: hypothetical protein VMD52_05355 [Patescibacteria group bacterium]|nr:hypothetical protein [Patescibacteria group bacterium]